MWTCGPAPGAGQVIRVLDYLFCFSDRIKGPKTTFAFWRYRVNDLLAEDDLIPDDPEEIALRQKGYPFHTALQPDQGQQWLLSYSAARKIYAITVKPKDRAALPFDRSSPDAGYAPRPTIMRADYEQLPEVTGYP